MSLAAVRSERATAGSRTVPSGPAIADITDRRGCREGAEDRREEVHALLSPTGIAEVRGGSGHGWGRSGGFGGGVLMSETTTHSPLRWPFYHHLRTASERSDAMIRDPYAKPPPQYVPGVPWAGPGRRWARLLPCGPPTTPSSCATSLHHHTTTTDLHARHPAL